MPRVPTRYRYRWNSAAFLAAMFLLAVLALIAVVVSSRAVPTPLLDERTMSAARELASIEEPVRLPLAQAGDVQLMLPVHQEQVTAIGYHPVNDPNVINLSPHGRQMNDNLLANLGRVAGAEDFGYSIMGDGSQLGSSTSSIDVGAPAGTVVFAPVDGTIAGIRAYNLKGACPDTEIKIQPLNQSNLIVVMTHLGNIQATLGQPVKAGVSRLGAVNKLDSCMVQPLGQFTYDAGNHVHMQVEALSSALHS